MKFKALYICLCGLCFAADLKAGVVEGPLTNSLTGHVFYIVASESWTEAQAEAHGLGGHLTTIRDSAENNWIVTNLVVDFRPSGGPNLSVLPLWIGLYNPTTNDGGRHAADFIWDSGETNSYRHWNSGEPNNLGNVEYYATINWHFAYGVTSDHSTWNDAPLNGSVGSGGTTTGPYYGIVEIGTGYPPLQTVPGAVFGPVASPINGHQYFIVPPNDWSNAQTASVALGGNLATVRSAAENSWLVTNMLPDLTIYGGPDLSTLPLWIGLYDSVMGSESAAAHAANFVWVSNETPGYRDWNPSTGEPTDTGGSEYFTAINWHFAQGSSSDHGVWDDTPANGTFGFGGNSDGPYYGIAEVNTGGVELRIGVTNSVITVTSVPNAPGAIVQLAASLAPPVNWIPVWTNSTGAPYTTTAGPGNLFFRLTY